jgi:RNA recognition motif-containing protein
MCDRFTQKSRGFGFVTFAEARSVELIISQKDSHQIRGKWIACKIAQPSCALNGKSDKVGIHDI